MKLKARLIALYLSKAIPKEAEKMFGKNWKTNLAGIGTYLGTLLLIIKCITCAGPECGSVYQCILMAITGGSIGTGFLAAKDHNVTGS